MNDPLSPHDRPDPARPEDQLSAVVATLARWAVPDCQSCTVVIVTPRGVSVQGGGSMKPRPLAVALRAFADRLDAEHARQSGLIIPGRGGP